MFAANDVIMPNVLSELCRVCLLLPADDDCLDLTTIYDEDENLTYAECFTVCTQIDLSEGDNLPHNLCRSCGLELQMCYDFYKKVEDSKRTIEQYKREIQENCIESDDTINVEQARHLSAQIAEVVSIHQELAKVETSENLKSKMIEDLDTDNEIGNVCVAEEDFLPITDYSEQPDIIQTVSEDEDTAESVDVSDLNRLEVDHSDGVLFQGDYEESLLLEEHLDINEYQSVEALEDEETETVQKKSTVSTLPLELISMEPNEKYTNAEVDQALSRDGSTPTELEDNRTPSLTSPSQTKVNNVPRKWQENVVTVATTGHLVMATDEIKGNLSPVEYTLIQSADELELEDNDSITEISSVQQPRKRRIGSYSCEYCHKVYPNYSRMINHRKCHESDRPRYPCDQCSRIYSTKQAMECHIQTEHKKTGFSCSVCSKVFAIRRSLEIHMRFHNGDFPFKCNLCDKKFAQLCHLNTHKNVKHNNVRFACDYANCGKFFTSSTSLRNHEYSHSAMPFECEYCTRGYPAKAKLRIHIKRKHGVDLSKEQLENMRKFHVMRSKVNLVQVVPIGPELGSTVNNIDNSDKLPDSKYDVIEYTAKEVKLKSQDQNVSSECQENETLSVMVLLKPRERRPILGYDATFICELCGHESSSKSLLASHRHRKHRLKEQTFKCTKCEKIFDSKQKLNTHLQRPFCEPYPTFKCAQCSKLISGYANYQVHLRFHEKIYPYVCHECGKSFMLATHLKAHIETKHENKRYVCEHANCGKHYQSRNSLKSHMYVHLDTLPYRCEYCEKMYANKGGLKYHIRKVHNITHILDELDRMLVGEVITLKTKPKRINKVTT